MLYGEQFHAEINASYNQGTPFLVNFLKMALDKRVSEMANISTSIPTLTPIPAAPSPTPMPKPPGFESIFAIVALLAVVYFLLRQRKV